MFLSFNFLASVFVLLFNLLHGNLPVLFPSFYLWCLLIWCPIGFWYLTLEFMLYVFVCCVPWYCDNTIFWKKLIPSDHLMIQVCNYYIKSRFEMGDSPIFSVIISHGLSGRSSKVVKYILSVINEVTYCHGI